MTAIHNSVYAIDQAKQAWADAEKKTGADRPRLEELKPYLGADLRLLEQMGEWGVSYEIFPVSEDQSAVATLTESVRFRGAVTFSHFYPAQTKFSLRGFESGRQWNFPSRGIVSQLFGILMIGLWVAGIFWTNRKLIGSCKDVRASFRMPLVALFTTGLGILLGFELFLVAYICHWLVGA